MITDKNEALEAIRTRNPNVLDQISPKLQDDMDIAMRVAEVFELQLRNTISLNGQDNSWNKAKEIMHEWDVLARQYRQKEEEAQVKGLIIDEDKALEAIRNGEAKLKDIMPEIIDKKMILEAIKQYGKSEQSYILNSMPQVKSMIQGDRAFRQEIKGILDEQARWETIDKKAEIKEEQAQARGLITDIDEALEAIKTGKAKLQDIMPEIVDKEMVLEAIRQYGNNQYTYATEINVRGISTSEFRREARVLGEQQKANKGKTVEQQKYEVKAPEQPFYGKTQTINFDSPEQPSYEFETPELPEIDDFDTLEQPEYVDDFDSPELPSYEFETPELPEIDDFDTSEQPEYVDDFDSPELPEIDDFDAPEQPDTMQPYSTATLGDEVRIQEGEREELTMELMRQIELAQGKSAEVAKLDKGIKGLENLERQYAKELDKYKVEGKVF